MKKVFALVTLLGMGVAIVGCSESKDKGKAAGGDKAPATTPAPAGDAK
ncbi:MAG: hypothetical protein HYX69_14615 [Planctomycetia bacterium]|nr:hypothetical protein [Planctomycetia bacterium]